MARLSLGLAAMCVLFGLPGFTQDRAGGTGAGMSMPTPLTDEPGNPARGLNVVRNAANASCLICHAMPIPDEPDHGTIAPPLDGVGDRLSEGELRLRLVDPKLVNPETMMPSYYRTEGLHGVDSPYVGRTIYTAQEVEDVVAYLMTLRAR
jgi:sulfur-oxidizing protein SoxX